MTDLSRCIITVCRDCCCGTTSKHPDVWHDEHLATLQAARGGSVRVSQCLAACELSNMIVVNPSRAGRAAGGRPAWLGEMLTDALVDDVVAWVEAGGPGLAPMPASLVSRTEAVKQLQARVAQG
jgi:hypothetical protein